MKNNYQCEELDSDENSYLTEAHPTNQEEKSVGLPGEGEGGVLASIAHNRENTSLSCERILCNEIKYEWITQSVQCKYFLYNLQGVETYGVGESIRERHGVN